MGNAPLPAIGVDLGGTKIEVLAIAADGSEILRRRRPTPKQDYAGTIEAVAGLIEEAEAALGGPATVGIGHPGAVSPATGLIKNANSTWLNGRPFDADVMARLGRTVAFANDANCLALSEATDGAGAGMPGVFAVIIGTGVGGGIVLDGRPVRGANAIGGEWGHNALPRAGGANEVPGPPCYCGLTGCIETWVSGPGFAADHRRVTGQDLHAPEIVTAAAAGDPAATATLERYVDRLARGLSMVVNLLDPDVIVLGGGMSNVLPIYQTIEARLAHWSFSDTLVTKVRQARHGDSSGVRGAAWLGRDAAGG